MPNLVCHFLGTYPVLAMVHSVPGGIPQNGSSVAILRQGICKYLFRCISCSRTMSVVVTACFCVSREVDIVFLSFQPQRVVHGRHVRNDPFARPVARGPHCKLPLLVSHHVVESPPPRSFGVIGQPMLDRQQRELFLA